MTTENSCPIAACASFLGDKWNLLILRELFKNNHRFEDFRKNLSIAPTILTKRLQQLCEQNIISKRRYSEHPPRDEYYLTPIGESLLPIILMMRKWGHEHLDVPYPSQVKNRLTDKEVDPVLIDKNNEKVIALEDLYVE
ncbi:hypothetical protein CKF54_07260 [Psittacicella hinzii]|uniref:HTH hxlR-type domain-containing protein n=1 Tax=Psittacicella hinzii TaxID=2028575 RepID=A0A3A1XYZ2_9GAMM|nr:helix-turn-helix domain-containing protein [Psittacicella hinzii]RIY31193.1 hypothetical protein CKF54_07260 [Psittacicella hinzii]